MTLKEAYNGWAEMKANKSLANRTRQPAEMVLIKPHGDIDIEDLSLDKAKRIFSDSEAPMQAKAQAASIMVHVMNYAAIVKKLKVPKFIYSELVYAVFHKEPQNTPLPFEQKPNETKQTKRGNPMRKVCKLDPKTLKVIDTFDSVKDAIKASGLKKLCNPLTKHQKGNGFYWCYAEEVDTFKPAPPPGRASKTLKESRKEFKKAISEHIAEVLSKLSDADLIAEIKKRGWQGNITKTISMSL